MKDEVYFHRELLTYSLEERNVELITITGHNDIKDEREENLPGLFPEYDEKDERMVKRFSKERSRKFSKKCIFLSARVHPGEV
jgi:hypothetical protein